ncbi:MAG: DUF6265 family protein [Limnohabitans sp.]|nr:DUF6265 family protein [Limnohabitans sp.]
MKNYFLLIIILFLHSCKTKNIERHFPLIEKTSWFLGEWRNQSKKGDFYENWKKVSDSTFAGVSYIMKGNDTIFNENVLLEQRNDSLFYDVSVNGQDETYFYLTKSSKKEVTFENPKHDFPTKITYKLISQDSIIATISGKIKGKEKSVTYPMHKKKK